MLLLVAPVLITAASVDSTDRTRGESFFMAYSF